MTRRSFIKTASVATVGTSVMPAQGYLLEIMMTLMILTFGGIVIIKLRMLRPRTFDLDETEPVVPTEQVPVPVIIPCCGPNGFPGIVATSYPCPASFRASIKPQNMPDFSRAATYIYTTITHKDDAELPKQTTEPIEVWASPSYFVALWRGIAYTGQVIPDTKIWLPMMDKEDKWQKKFFTVYQ